MSFSKWFVAAMVSAPIVALGASSTKVMSPGAEKDLSWKPDPAASGPLAAYPGDHMVIGRVASDTGGKLLVGSDLGGTQTLNVNAQTKVVGSGGPASAQDFKTGDVVSVAYHGSGADRTADAVMLGDASLPGASATASAASGGAGAGKQ